VEQLLLTGASGFIGVNLLRHLSKEKYEITTLGRTRSEGYGHIAGDLSEPGFEKALQELKPRIVVHLGGNVSVAKSLQDPLLDLKINTEGTVRVLRAVSTSCKSFVFVNSGGAIYRQGEQSPLGEEADLEPSSPYGVSKLAAENYISVYARLHGFDWTSLALSNVFGHAREQKNGVIRIFNEALLKHEKITINNPNAARDFIHVDDVCRVILSSIQTPTNCRLNIGSGLETKIIDLLRMMEISLGISADSEIVENNQGEVTRNSLSPQKANALLNWQPEITLRDALDDILIKDVKDL
jgi:UDP-glucose 4-epimerase